MRKLHNVLSPTQILLLAMLVLLQVSIGLVSAAEETSLSAIEIYDRSNQTVMPVLDQFRATARAEIDGVPVGTAVIGWASGLKATATVNAPQFFPGVGTVSFALRPSGFALTKAGQYESVFANLATDPLVLLIPRLLNRDLLGLTMRAFAGELSLAGTAHVAGREAHILEQRFDPHTMIEELGTILPSLLADPVLSSIFGDSLDEDSTQLLEALGAAADSAGEFPPVRTYVDKLDFVALGVDEETFAAYWAAQADSDLPMPMLSIRPADVTLTPDGHVDTVAYQVTMDFTCASLGNITRLGDCAATGTEDDTLMTFALRLELKRHTAIYLPTSIEMMLKMDPSLGVQVAGGGQHTARLSLQWDLSRGPDLTLLNNMRLVGAERAWANAMAAFETGDIETETLHLERLVQLAPEFYRAHSLLSSNYISTGQIDLAIATLETQLELNPFDGSALNNLAYLLVDYDIDAERGLDLVLEALEYIDDERLYMAAFDTLAWAYYKTGSPEEALEAMELTVEMAEELGEAEDAILHYHLGAILAALERHEDARAHLETALELDPELVDAQQLLETLRQPPAQPLLLQ